MGGVYTGCLAYADDLILISASVVKLQKMLDICSTYGTNLDIIFNPTKSCFFKKGKDFYKNVPDLCIDGQNMAWVDTLNIQVCIFTLVKLLR